MIVFISRKKLKHLEESVTHLSNENINLKHEKAQILLGVEETLSAAYNLVGSVVEACGMDVVNVTQNDINRFQHEKKCLVEYDESGYKLRVVDKNEEDR